MALSLTLIFKHIYFSNSHVATTYQSGNERCILEVDYELYMSSSSKISFSIQLKRGKKNSGFVMTASMLVLLVPTEIGMLNRPNCRLCSLSAVEY